MRFSAICLAACGLLVALPAQAQQLAYDFVDFDHARFATFADQMALPPGAVARVDLDRTYGPFRVLDGARAALVGVTDAASPAAFADMLRDHPGIVLIEMLDCPGTEDDLANLDLGRMIRARGIATHVPSDGSVRSGAVELFLAGSRRYADAGAEFAVHAWLDVDGLEPADYAADDPQNTRYLDYYRQMGMSGREARAFYAMTNSVPFESARWFGAAEMARWVALDTVGQATELRTAGADVSMNVSTGAGAEKAAEIAAGDPGRGAAGGA